MPNLPVKIGISSKGFDRNATVTSDTAGAFTYTFTPSANEAGSYSVWATHPELSDRTVQAQFSIIGLQVSPQKATIQLLKGKNYDIPVTLTNLGGGPLTGLTLTPSNSSGMTATPENTGATTLNAGETRTITFRVGADLNSPASGFANLDISTQEGLTSTVAATITTISALPVITTSPSYTDTGLMRGNQRIENLTIKNSGAETLYNPRIEGPSLPWLSLTNDKNLGDIATGQSKTVGILINPGDTITQGTYNDRLVIYSDNHIPYTYNVQVTVTSSATGNVQFSVLNELMKDVAGASITFQNQSVLELIQTITTDSSGTAAVFDLPEGRYSYNISAPGAMPTSGSFVIVPGTTTSVPIAMELTLVKIEWSVTPVTITDSYDIRISQTYETNVPTPVLVIEPAGLNIPDLQPGQVFNGELTVSNYGLIALDNVKATFPSSIGDYDIELMSSSLPNRLNAMQKVVVPYRITRRVTTAANTTSIGEEITGYGGGTCYTSKLLYTIIGTAVICPNTPQQKTVEKKSDVYGNFPTTCSTGVGGTTSSSSTYTGVSVGGTQPGGAAGAGTSKPLPSNNPCNCVPDGDCCGNGPNRCQDNHCKTVELTNVDAMAKSSIGDASKNVYALKVEENISLEGKEEHNDLCEIDYSWDFGDGSPAVKAKSTSHKYQYEGTYSAIFTAKCKKCGPPPVSIPITVKILKGCIRIYVDQPRPGTNRILVPWSNVGHVWWKMEVSDDVTPIPDPYKQYANFPAGYYGDGLHFPDNTHEDRISVTKSFRVKTLAELIAGLKFTDNLRIGASTYQLCGNNCANNAIEAASSVGVALPDQTDNWAFCMDGTGIAPGPFGQRLRNVEETCK